MSPVVAANGPTWFWYLARGSGLVSLVLLTISVVLGIVTSVRWSSARWPRFAIQLVHRNVSLLAVVFIFVHVATVVVDGFAPIGWLDTVVPFLSGYRPFWLGLGAIALDLVLALNVTSLVRHRIGPRTWRAIHWLAYVCWPFVVLHGLGSGSDAKLGFVLVANAACVAAVVIALWWRLADGWPQHAGTRVAGLTASLVGPLLLGVWAADGPLAAGWARDAGTPAALLPQSVAVATPAGSTPSSTATTAVTASGLPAVPFTAQLAGTQAESAPNADGRVLVRLRLALSGGATGSLGLDLTGQETGQGLSLEDSTVTLGPPGDPAAYRGQVFDVQAGDLLATVQTSGGRALDLTIRLAADQQTGRVRGALRAAVASEGPSSGNEGGEG